MSEDPELEALKKRKLAELMAQAQAAEDAAPAPAAEQAPAEPITVTDANLLEQADKHPLLVVDCWAPWCGPCRTVEPVVKDLAREMKGSVVFGKLNVDENPRSAQAFHVASIPTFLVFRHGELVDRLQGALPKPQLAAALRKHLPRRSAPGPRRL